MSNPHPSKPPKTKPKNKPNVFTDTNGIIAREGHHEATVISTQHIGRTKTIYGTKDFQMFVLQVTQYTDDMEKEIAEIHQAYTRSFSSQASLPKFLAGFGIDIRRGMTFDFDDLVGKKVRIIVTHSTDSHGVKHANITTIPLKRPASANGGSR
jgi:hypothetical protein